MNEVLEDGADPTLPRPGVERAQVLAIDRDAPVRRVIEASEQLHQRGLAGTVLAHDRQ